jgi:hypothetical protein
MCEPTLIAIGIGAAVGAATSAATGNDPLMGALIGGATAGFMPGSFGVTPGFDLLPGVLGVQLGSTAVAFAPIATASMAGLAGGYLKNAMLPQQADYNQAYTGMPYTPQAYSSQHAKVTGSGGRQAAAVLASEIKQAKSLRKRQAEVADYGLGMSVAGTGLQIAA